MKLYTRNFCTYSQSKDKNSELCFQKRNRLQLVVLLLPKCYTYSDIVYVVSVICSSVCLCSKVRLD